MAAVLARAGCAQSPRSSRYPSGPCERKSAAVCNHRRGQHHVNCVEGWAPYGEAPSRPALVDQEHRYCMHRTGLTRDERLTPLNGASLAAIPASRRILVPRNVSFDQAAECVQHILRLGASSTETLLVYPHAGSANYDRVMEIVDALGVCPAPTIGFAMGSLMNSGCLLLQACTTRVMSRFAQIELGNYSWTASVLFGPGEELAAVYDGRVRPDLDKVLSRQEQTVNALVRRSRLSREKVTGLLNEEPTLSAEQALRLGIVDEVV